MRRFLIYLCLALAATVPALWIRITGAHAAPIPGAMIFGAAILASGFMLSWGAEAAEQRVSQGLMIAGLALVTVLPEYAVDIYLALRAGQFPASDYVHLAAANMTGANRLLVGLGWPLIVLLSWLRSGARQVDLRGSNRTELVSLAAATAYAFVIVFKSSIGIVDFALLLGIFGAYIWKVSTAPRGYTDDDDDDEIDEIEPGPAAALEKLGVRAQWAWTAGLTGVAGAVIIMSAEPFAESLLAAASALGADRFLAVQWLAPLTGETPEMVLAVLFVMALKPGTALIALISDKINQWTLLVGALPIAMSIGAGHLISLPLGARQHEEFFLTASQSVFALTLLLERRLRLPGAALLGGLFAVQLWLAFALQGDSSREIAALTTLAWVYLALALCVVGRILFRGHRRNLRWLIDRPDEGSEKS